MTCVEAYAKLNLGLRIVGRRPDGYHELDSIVQTVDLADRITFEIEGDCLRVENTLDVPMEQDLGYRAARAMLEQKGVSIGVRIRIDKRIPVGAGLGGGSTDAAAILTTLDQLTPPEVARDTLHQLATKLGADVPLFLTGGTLRIRGIGENVEPLNEDMGHAYAVVVPPIHCDTAKVYGALHRERIGTPNGRPPEPGENDLLEPALRLYPGLRSYLETIGRIPCRFAGMSGSGSAFYAACDCPEQAHEIADRLRVAHPEAGVYVVCPTPQGQGRVEARRTQ